ncbi:PucR family transcriptional regulator [Actinokineospora iranica]|uniref:DNA-binding transcriptional regulator, PucR family n=1 Tax=Actinokineospora iranica TaxID=1271860 RepID=A0A1G6MWT6_9PSEU|nr:helix-turn-helix domain-containing protein [Actinokineospora iranica]SDC59714.1 DNA-binding transcriptional regulator, PucR family [Actinokineospora iranica]
MSGSSSGSGGLSLGTLDAVGRASGKLAAAAVAAMDEQFAWFGRMPADQRASVLLVAQNGVAGFTAWLRDPREALRMTTDTFRGAPRDLSRWISLRQTVEMVRVSLQVFERMVPDLAADEAERAVLSEAVLRYGREVAFASAMSYASAAEARGAWDARLEALVVDGIVRGDAEESLLSRAAALGWDPAAQATVLVGNPPSDDPPTVLYEVRSRAARLGRPVLLGVQGSRLVVVLAGPTEDAVEHEAMAKMAEAFGAGAVVAGPTMPSIAEAHRSSADALSGLRAVVAWPEAPRPVRSSDLLPERALAGDPEAEWQLIDRVARPLEESGGALQETVEAYLGAGGVLETCARQLFVHPNTVRYRLRKVTELTGRNPSDPRDALVLRIALAVGRLSRSRGLW